jgi:hypothetical protein
MSPQKVKIKKLFSNFANSHFRFFYFNFFWCNRLKGGARGATAWATALTAQNTTLLVWPAGEVGSGGQR